MLGMEVSRIVGRVPAGADATKGPLRVRPFGRGRRPNAERLILALGNCKRAARPSGLGVGAF